MINGAVFQVTLKCEFYMWMRICEGGSNNWERCWVFL